MKKKLLLPLTLGFLFSSAAIAQYRGPAQTQIPSADFDDTASVGLRADPNNPNTGVAQNERSVDSGDFQVTTTKIGGGHKKEAPRPIQLMLPAHNSTFTPGVITFTWKLTDKLKNKKVTFVLEKVDSGKKAAQPWHGEKLSMELKSGRYRWQVVSNTPKMESHWRFFKVIDLKSGSVTDLYEGRSPGEREAPAPKKSVAKSAPTKKVSRGRPLSGGQVTPTVEVDNTVSDAAVPRSVPLEGLASGAGDVDTAMGDDALEQARQEKMKAEQAAKSIAAQLEEAKREHMKAIQNAKMEAARLKAERDARLKAEKIARERAAKAEAERVAKLKAEREAKIRAEKIKKQQLEEARLAKTKAEKALKKLQVKLEAEKRAKDEAEKAAAELATKVEAARQAKLKAEQLANQEPGAQDEGEGEEDAQPAPPPARRQPVNRRGVAAQPAADPGPQEPPVIPDFSQNSEEPQRAPVQRQPVRRGTASVRPAQSMPPPPPAVDNSQKENSVRKQELDELKFSNE